MIVLAALAASGCATTGEDRASPDGALASPRKVVLVEMPMRTDDERLRQQFAPKFPKGSPESRQAITNAVASAEARALATARKVLEKTGITVDDSEATSRALDQLHLDDPELAITREMAGQLHAASGDDALLRFQITDYGATPKSWRNAYIAFEVTSTLGIAAIAYSYPATRAIAGVYLVEEGIEETAEGYAGFWALDELARPVRIRAELISLDTGSDVWKGSATGLSDIRPVRLVRKVSPAERDAQRARAIDEAVQKVVVDVREALGQADRGISSHVPGR